MKYLVGFLIALSVPLAVAENDLWELSGEIQPDELAGFKDIKFGLTVDEVETLGFSCKENVRGEDFCFVPFGAYTFLGAPAVVNFKYGIRQKFLQADKGLGEIYVSINESSEEIRSTLIKSLGSPFVLRDPEHDLEKVLPLQVWIFANGATLEMSVTRYDASSSNVFYRSPGRSFERFKLLFRKLELTQFVPALDETDL